MSEQPRPSTRPAPTGSPLERVGPRLAAFGAVLVVMVSVGFGVGRVTGPDRPGRAGTTAQGAGGDATGTGAAGDATATGAGGNATATGAESGRGDHHHDPDAAVPGGGLGQHGDLSAGTHVHDSGSPATTTAGGADAAAGGLAVTAAGLTLVPRSSAFRVGRPQSWRFHIAAADGRPVTEFAVVHDRPLHLIVVRRDLTGYQHLHPTMAPDGTWSVDLTLGAAGSWRAYADFTAVSGGARIPVTLGVDLTAAGEYAPATLPAPSTTAQVAGFTVAYEGAPRTGATQPLLVRVTGADGRPASLQPYLGAFGHLVVLRDGDLGYVHVHPEAGLTDGAVKFWLAAPGPGRYRMFYDFQVGGRVHTAAFTLPVS